MKIKRKLFTALFHKLVHNLKRSWFEIHDNLPSMFFTALMLVSSGLIFKQATWDELSLYWQRVDEGFDNEAQKRKVIRYGKLSVITWIVTLAFLWAYFLVSEGISFLITAINTSNAFILFIPTAILFILKTFAGVVIFMAGIMICCMIGVLINVLLALIRSRISFYAALAVGLANMVLLFMTHYTIPIFMAQGSFLPAAMRDAYLNAIFSSETMISGIVGLFSVIGIGSIHMQFLKTDGMFRLFRINLKEKQIALKTMQE